MISFSRLSVGRSPFNESAKISEGAPLSFPRPSWLNQFIFPPFSVAALSENKKRALNRGLKISYGRLTVDRMARSFRKGFIPIALVHMEVTHQLNFPHWVVVTDTGDDNVDFNDPYPPKGGKGIRVRKEQFQRMLDDIGTRIGLSPSIIFIRNCRPLK